MLTASLVAQFSARFGESPTHVARAPGRINLIGEHTDYNEGLVLPLSIDREAACAFRQNGTDAVRLVALDLDARLEVELDALAPQPEQWANYALGVVAALRARGHAIGGFDAAFRCDVPSGAGLSSSAAIASAFAIGLSATFELRLPKWTLVEVAQAAENDFVGAPTGYLDQFASVFGRRGHALFLDCRDRSFVPVELRLPGHELVVLNTGVQHNHLTSGYGDRRAACVAAVAALQALGWSGSSLRDLTADQLKTYGPRLDERLRRRARFVVEENARVRHSVRQLGEGDVVGFGESLLAGHRGLARDYEVSCAESDAVVRFGESHPACKGARQMGGGFGGCILCVVEAEAVTDFVDAAQQDYFERFAIALEALELASGPGARAEALVSADELAAGQAATRALDLDDTPHRRLNVLTGEWMLVSPHRAKRPWQGQTEEIAPEQARSYEPDCYLCPGNTRAGGAVNPAYTTTYAFDNDFAALRPDAGEASYHDGLLVAEAERGLCRVLCFSPDHAKTLATMTGAELRGVVALWQAQYAELGARAEINHVQIFENKGALMGCSNPHPHGQVWAQATVPQPVLRKHEQQLAYYRATEGESLLSAYLEQEVAAETRLLHVSAHFVALVPWWAVWPFEVLVAPRRPMAHIGMLDGEEAEAFAQALGEVTRRYDALFGVSFPYSAGIHQAPTDGADHDHWHWHMEFKPPLLRSATVRKFMVGYELFASAQRDLTPETAAERLRGVSLGGAE